MKGPPAAHPHLSRVSECKRGASIGEPCLSMAGGVRSLLRPRGGCEVCMCRFCTHTLDVSKPLAEFDGHRQSPSRKLRFETQAAATFTWIALILSLSDLRQR